MCIVERCFGRERFGEEGVRLIQVLENGVFELRQLVSGEERGVCHRHNIWCLFEEELQFVCMQSRKNPGVFLQFYMVFLVEVKVVNL